MNKQDINNMIISHMRQGRTPFEALEILENDPNVDKVALTEWFDSFNSKRGVV